MKNLIFTMFVLAVLALTACGQQPGKTASGGADKCFDLRGVWRSGADTITFGDMSNNARCHGQISRCASTFFIRSENPDGSYLLSLYGGAFANDQPPSPECPGPASAIQAAGQTTTCRFDVTNSVLTMDCGNGAAAYTRQ